MTGATPLPKLFIGSSGESLPVVQTLTEKLKLAAEITPWTDRSIFQPLHFFVQDLLRIPHLFDFGLFLFEPDDSAEVRGVHYSVPRDNVIFELGLFMSRLGLTRAFAVAPRGRVKILSDIAGLKLIEYDLPAEVPELRKSLKTENPAARKALEDAIRAKLDPALALAAQDIVKILQQGPVPRPGVFPDAPNVLQVGPTMTRLLNTSIELHGSASVRHLALDMGEAWGILAEEILHPSKESKNITWRCLMIDPESTAIQPMSSHSVSMDVAKTRIGQMLEFLGKNAPLLRTRNLQFECRLYSEPPQMHGFLIDRIALLWSMCDVVAGELDGSSTPYWRFDAADPQSASNHPARSFGHWFDHRWNNAVARKIWPR
jgi:predicted nucleotide-binding protein